MDVDETYIRMSRKGKEKSVSIYDMHNLLRGQNF